jgi:hypothetical protein
VGVGNRKGRRNTTSRSEIEWQIPQKGHEQEEHGRKDLDESAVGGKELDD